MQQGGVRELAWFAGERDDVADIMRGLDCFVLPSLAEGVSNTILEAMACALPVIATRVGGNAELVDDDAHRAACAGRRSTALAHAILDIFRRCRIGAAARPARGRERIEEQLQPRAHGRRLPSPVSDCAAGEPRGCAASLSQLTFGGKLNMCGIVGIFDLQVAPAHRAGDCCCA